MEQPYLWMDIEHARDRADVQHFPFGRMPLDWVVRESERELSIISLEFPSAIDLVIPGHVAIQLRLTGLNSRWREAFQN